MEGNPTQWATLCCVGKQCRQDQDNEDSDEQIKGKIENHICFLTPFFFRPLPRFIFSLSFNRRGNVPVRQADRRMDTKGHEKKEMKYRNSIRQWLRLIERQRVLMFNLSWRPLDYMVLIQLSEGYYRAIYISLWHTCLHLKSVVPGLTALQPVLL